MDRLIETFRKILGDTHATFHRYMYDRITWDDRLVGIVGPRGVGKTTMMLQYIKEHLDVNKTLYVTADDFYFANHRLVELADSFAKMGGEYLFIDEIHKHTEWSRELKLIYDYHPELHIVFSGSSVLDITKGTTADLSRRAVVKYMQGLSFREYLAMFHQMDLPVLTLEDIIHHRVELPRQFRPLSFFRDYLMCGYYPFAGVPDYGERLVSIINKTLEVDIPQYAELSASMSRKLKRLLIIISQSVPFKPNMTTIGQTLGVSRNHVGDYLLYLEEAGLIAQLRDTTSGIRGLGKVEKVYLDNANLIYALADRKSDVGNVRETFFMNQMRVRQEVVNSRVSDFEIDNLTFEVGGRKKGNKQIAAVDNGYVVKDDIEYGYANVVPLWAFGLNY
ncbi:MAG: ATP-binding protein [Prevotella sp.]|nr:ATP-binding protein [Prevotella sp.]